MLSVEEALARLLAQAHRIADAETVATLAAESVGERLYFPGAVPIRNNEEQGDGVPESRG